MAFAILRVTIDFGRVALHCARNLSAAYQRPLGTPVELTVILCARLAVTISFTCPIPACRCVLLRENVILKAGGWPKNEHLYVFSSMRREERSLWSLLDRLFARGDTHSENYATCLLVKSFQQGFSACSVSLCYYCITRLLAVASGRYTGR